MITITKRCSAAVLICVIITGCTGSPSQNLKQTAHSATDHQEIVAHQYQLFFGLSKLNGEAVTQAEWNAFESNTLALMFLDGYTITDATGFYQGSQEKPKILTLIVWANDAKASTKKINTIVQHYATSFNQDSAMLTKISLLDWQFINKIQTQPSSCIDD